MTPLREVSLNPETPQNRLIVYSSEQWRHDLLSGTPDSFNRLLSQLSESQTENKCKVEIPVTKQNFHQLSTTLRWLLPRVGALPSAEIPSDFQPKPLATVHQRFTAYLQDLKAIVNQGVIIGDADPELLELLSLMERRQAIYDQRLLLRVLGVICDASFIGPLRLLIDPTPLCNIDCLYCRAHSPLRKELNREWRAHIKDPYLPFELFTKIIDDAVALDVASILVVGGGEPTIHPRFREMVEYVADRNLEFNLSTNGLLLNDRIAAAMARLPAGSLTCSLSAATPETFVRLHPSRSAEDFFRIIENLKNLRAKCPRGTGERLRFKALFVITKYNLEEIVRFAELTRDLEFHEVWYQLVHVDPYCQFLQPTLEDKPMIEESLARAQGVAKESGIEINSYVDFQLEHLDNRGRWSQSFFARHGCNVGWQFCYVSYRGEVSFCCGMKVVDSLSQSKSLADIWHSQAYNRFRSAAKRIHEPRYRGLTFQNGVTLYDAYCECCDNHNFNKEMLDQIKDSGFSRFLATEPENRTIVRRAYRFISEFGTYYRQKLFRNQ